MRPSEGNVVCAVLFSEVEKDTSFQKWMLKAIQLLWEKLCLFKKCCLSLLLNHSVQVIQNLQNMQGFVEFKRILAYSDGSKVCCNI